MVELKFNPFINWDVSPATVKMPLHCQAAAE